ncbi:amidohydrolase family protein [uncultured Martelella sp.]|uniref:amidohydrolase family protein n=1 Tax=uncultured Martelella sp. TaxID=392331 RepID=UPI0029C97CF8|nr:amidohydrolase family protein [uncultured Martelella sp.]
MQTIVDAHLHIWDLEAFSLPWLDDVPAARHTVSEDDYRTDCVTGPDWQIRKSVYIEVDVATDQKQQEIDHITAICADPGSMIAAAVVSADLSRRDGDAWLEQLTRNPAIRGIRHVLHVPASPRGACLEPAFVQNVRKLGASGLHFEACLRCEELSDLVRLAELCPQTPIMLNHMGIVDAARIAGAAAGSDEDRRYRDLWLENIARLGQLSNVSCKISGLAAGADEVEAVIAPVLDHCFGSFGDKRIVFATNYPVSETMIPARRWIESVLKHTAAQSETFRDRLFFENACRFYRISL